MFSDEIMSSLWRQSAFLGHWYEGAHSAAGSGAQQCCWARARLLLPREGWRRCSERVRALLSVSSRQSREAACISVLACRRSSTSQFSYSTRDFFERIKWINTVSLENAWHIVNSQWMSAIIIFKHHSKYTDHFKFAPLLKKSSSWLKVCYKNRIY